MSVVAVRWTAVGWGCEVGPTAPHSRWEFRLPAAKGGNDGGVVDKKVIDSAFFWDILGKMTPGFPIIPWRLLVCLMPAVVWLLATTCVRAEIYVSKLNTSEVFAYDENTGAKTGVFVAAGLGGLNQPHGILHRGADLLVASFGTNSIKRYARVGGTPLGDFITASGGLDQPVLLRIGRDGKLYISSQGNDRMLRFDLQTGAALDSQPFIQGGQLDGPSGFGWSPDGAVLYVAGRYSGNVLAYNALTGAPLAVGHVVASGLGLGTTFGLAVELGGDIFVATGGQVRRFAPGGLDRGTITVSAIGLELSADSTAIVAASAGNLRSIRIMDHNVGSTQLSPSVGGTLNFFSLPPKRLGAQSKILEIAGQRYCAMQFQVTKWSPGETGFFISEDLIHWRTAVAYSPTGTAATRRGSLTSVVEVIDQGETLLITERDAEPIGTQGRRFYQMFDGTRPL